MITPAKLARLPRHQRLRKAEKILALLERRLAGESGVPEPADLSPLYLAEVLGLFAADGDFSAGERRVFGEAALCCDPRSPAAPGGFRRALNAARHVLLAATGRYPADWDFIYGEGLLDGAKRRVFPGMRVYLEDIRSPFNVGAMFRAAESFGVEKLWLSPSARIPNTPGPGAAPWAVWTFSPGSGGKRKISWGGRGTEKIAALPWRPGALILRNLCFPGGGY